MQGYKPDLMMEPSTVFKQMLTIVSLVSISASYAQDPQPLSCDLDEVPAYVISFDQVFTKLVSDQPDMKGRRTVIATTDINYLEETGERLDISARLAGEIQYNPYRKEQWETHEAIYTYHSQDNIARVRLHAPDEKSVTPYTLVSKSAPSQPIAGYRCNWDEVDVAGVQKTQRCLAVFYGWTIPLYTRKIAEGRDVLFSEATDITQRCIKKASLYVPQDKPWRFSK